MTPSDRYDFVVLGSGVAGLWFALHAADHGRVLVATKSELFLSSSSRAQGGVAAVMDPEDTLEAHARDTHVAGAGLCDSDAVHVAVSEGPAEIRALVALGVEFACTHETGEFDLGREGGHNARRVLHAGDITGAVIQESLIDAVSGRENIDILEHHTAVDVAVVGEGEDRRCVGVWLVDNESADLRFASARATVISTGGCGRLFAHTTNPDVATGDGVAMAWRVGCAIRNMEFIQFHPTALNHPQADGFLISEALRGEGGVLVNSRGEPFMDDIHPLASLAPRDIVARAIVSEIAMTGPVYLDMTKVDPEFLVERFPAIHERCMDLGLDMRQRPLPVAPAAHFSCGGIATDLHGRTGVAGLLSIGEAASTGLHGANRLASNSLLEGLVFARRAVAVATEQPAHGFSQERPDWSGATEIWERDRAEMRIMRDELRRLMSGRVGIVRTNRSLDGASRRLALLYDEAESWVRDLVPERSVVELRNLITVGRLIVASARQRQESRGLHYLIDAPAPEGETGRDVMLEPAETWAD